jgi:hypothetical protein
MPKQRMMATAPDSRGLEAIIPAHQYSVGCQSSLLRLTPAREQALNERPSSARELSLHTLM